MWSYDLCFAIAVGLFVAGIVATFMLRNSSDPVSIRPINCLIVGVFTSATMLFIPIYARMFRGDLGAAFKTVLLSMHNALRLFIVDGEFDIIDMNITRSHGIVYGPYTLLAGFLYVLAPILTFSAILSLIKNAYAYAAFFMAFFRDTYVFSELNLESAALATDIKKNHPHSAIVFTDVFDNNEEHSYELMQKARSLLAILFKSDVGLIDFKLHSRRKKITFIMTGKDESESIRQSMFLIKKYRNRGNTELYVFSSLSEGELLLSDIDKGKMKVRRINENNTIITRYLYENGEELFDNAVRNEQGIKEINAVIVGMGKYGCEMLKTLSWFCQMDGYRLYLDAYDKDPDALDKFTAECPELMDPAHNGVFDPDDSEYLIRIFPGMDVDTGRFGASLRGSERKTSFVFVSLGDDDENVRVSTNLRTLFEREGLHPQIVTMVQDSHVNHGLSNIHNFSGQPYDIDFIGSIEDVYSEKAIIGTDLEMEALSRHLKWGSEEDFWKYEYNYKSSVATTMHTKMKSHCRIPGADKIESELTIEERNALERLEHRRWNAYMRSEGYVYSGSPDPSSRNNLGKMHHDLIPYSSLSEEDKRKDSKVTTK